jgi:hypothetical protein
MCAAQNTSAGRGLQIANPWTTCFHYELRSFYSELGAASLWNGIRETNIDIFMARCLKRAVP